MAEYYQTRVAAIVAEESDSGKAQSATLLGETLTPMASKVLSTLGSYERRHRTGDRYVRAMFDCALIFYIDKFGSQGCHWPSRSALSGPIAAASASR